jgi:signal transduction histidine kinase
VTLPVAGLVVLWGLALAALFGAFGGHGYSWPSHDLATLTLSVGGGLVVIIASVLLAGAFIGRLRSDIRGLAAAARRLADEHLPQAVDGIRRGEGAAHPATAPQVPVKTAELAMVGAAIASCQRTAVDAAAGEAGLRNGLGQVFVSLARRNQSLLQRQLRLIDELEQKASDPATLADLFPLDHLTTRMRRHAESLIILSGAAPGRSWSQPVPVIDVIRGAVAEVEDYTRVRVVTSAGDAIAGSAAADMIHLLAELIENATLFSPSSTRAEVRAERVANGFAVEVDDRGLGIKPDQLAAINEQLLRPPDFDLANADRLGLFVVGRLAARHGVKVSLRPSPYGGTSAVVLMPNSIVVPSATAAMAAATGAHALPSARLDLRAGPPALPARQPSPPSLPAGLPAGQAGLPQAVLGDGRDAPALGGPGGGGLGGSGLASSGLGGGGLGGGGLSGSGLAGSGLGGGGLGGTGLAGGGGRRALPQRSAKPGPATAEGTYRGLPRRVRQANLSPHLRDGGAADAAPPGVLGAPGTPGLPGATPLSAPPAETETAERTPQEARDLMSSLQRGWRRGREPEDDGDTGGLPPARDAGPATGGESLVWGNRGRGPEAGSEER